MGLFKKRQHSQVRQPHISEHNDAYVFRRSRTMTGSLSDSVRAAAETRADLQSERLKHHTLRKKRRSIALYLLTTLLLAGGLVLLLNASMLSVSLKPVAGVPPDTLAGYTKEIDTYLAGHPNERFGFALRTDALTQALQKKFPEVASVSLRPTPWLKAAIGTITLRQPIATWTLGTTKYYIDDHGVAFERYYGAEPGLVVEDKTGIDPTSSGAVASERMIHYIGRLVALLGAAGYKVEKLELPPVTSHEVDVRLVGKGYTIKTSLDRDPAGQVFDIVNAIKFLDGKNLKPAYADVRVNSRLYYK